MDTSFHYLLMVTQSLFQRSVMAALSQSGLTAGQPKVLDYLGLHDGAVQRAIAAGCQIEPATLSGLLSRMEDKGLIYRQSVPGDKRASRVFLTPLGWQKQKEVRQVLESQTEALLSKLDPSLRQPLLEGLKQACQWMTDTEDLQ
ncbi:MAG: MarR family transcriptional regulator [Evtepia sp.]|uniref:MarR family winged helix-turn-helix transcriptional regulator n=1 Tax=Evtepia sp. TaxID=2773933 RepID=UPI002A74B6D4|nr:MarR family transcriptional regulator [Evtepia sp.]MDY3014700.1 MarR family transcriptional regulator [Evtepia sp.]